MSTYEIGRLYQLPATELQPDPEQPRKYLDPAALHELSASVKVHGVLQPVLFRLDEAGRPVLVAGERRLHAAREAGLETLPALFIAGNPAEIALVENILRENLTAVEEAEALGRLVDAHGYTQEQLAAAIGKARSTVAEILSLNRLPAEIRDGCRADPAVPRRALVEIARHKQARAMLTAWRKYRQQLDAAAEEKDSGRRRPRLPAAERAARDAGKFSERVMAVDLTGWTDADLDLLKAALESLRATLAEKIAIIDHPETRTPLSPGLG